MKTLIPNTTPQEQFASDVVPPFEFYMTDKHTEWKARCAANAIAHFTEHVYEYYKYHDPAQLHGAKTAQEFAYHLADNNGCRELAYIWEFALLGKHRFVTTSAPGGRPRYLGDTTTGSARHSTIIGSTDSVLFATTVVSDTGSATEQQGVLVFTATNGPVHEAVTTAFNFLKARLSTMPTYK